MCALTVHSKVSPQYIPLCCVLYLQGRLSEEYWAQLKEAASCAQVVKVKVNVQGDVLSYCDCIYTRASRALAAGFSKNPLLREVELGWVPEELVESVRGTLCTNTALTVKVHEP